MRPLKREGRRSQYCGPSDSPKHTKFCHDRSSVLIITITWRTCVAFFHYNLSQSRKNAFPLLSIHCDALCQSFLLAMSGHAGPIQMDLGIAPLVLRISLGQAVALLKGRRACRADLTGGSLSNRASDGECGQPKSRDGRCQPELSRGLGEQPCNCVSLCFQCHVLAPDRMSQLPGLRRD
jgi:hypothetical protein